MKWALALVGAVFILDRWTKSFFFGKETAPVIGSFLQTTSHHNFGLIANLPVPPFVIVLVTGTIALVVAWAFWHSLMQERTLRALSLAIILGGALGNLTDRLTFGYVFDWILLFNWSIINIADIAIGLGIVLYLFSIRSRNTKRE